MKKTQELKQENINLKVEEVKEKAKRESRQSKQAFSYDAKSVKIDFDTVPTLKELVGSYYSKVMYMAKIVAYANNNITIYQKELNALLDIESPTSEDTENISILNRNIEIMAQCSRKFKKEQNKALAEVCSSLDIYDEKDEKHKEGKLYLAYVNRDTKGEVSRQAFKNALREVLSVNFGIELKDDSLLELVHSLVGVKSAGLNAKSEGSFILAQKQRAFYTLIMDILTDLAIRKQKITLKMIDKAFEEVQEIEVFKDYAIIEKPQSSKDYTKEFYFNALESLGVDVKASMKKSELINLFNKELRKGSFIFA